MNPIIIFLLVVIAILLILYLVFQTRIGTWLFGIEYFEETYTFQKSMNAESIKELFKSIELKKRHPKDVFFYINPKTFYSISDKGMGQWSPWIDIGEMPDKVFDGFDLKWRDAWSIVIHGHDLHCAVYNGDTHLLYADEVFETIRLVGLGIPKYPWNIWKIRKEQEFVSYISESLKELEHWFFRWLLSKNNPVWLRPAGFFDIVRNVLFFDYIYSESSSFGSNHVLTE